jgi:hypothetical protein
MSPGAPRREKLRRQVCITALHLDYHQPQRGVVGEVLQGSAEARREDLKPRQGGIFDRNTRNSSPLGGAAARPPWGINSNSQCHRRR